MFRVIKDVLNKCFNYGREDNVYIPEICQEENKDCRRYRNIPLYTEEEMETAIIDDSEETRYACLGRQAINGYVGIYKDIWIVGRRRDGMIVKTSKPLSRGYTDIKKTKERVLKLQNKALHGYEMQNEEFCKFTYDLENGEKFSTHVTLEREYVENEIMEDTGNYGGLYFTSIKTMELCAEHSNTFYGNKIAVIKPLPEEIYYECFNDAFVGRKVYVEKIMYMNEVETWEYLNQRFACLKDKKDVLCEYLKDLYQVIPEENYDDCIEYLEKL